jgi:hypothetical protein
MTYRRTTDYRDIIDAYHEMECEGAVSLKFLAEGTATHRADFVALVGELEKVPGWVVERHGRTSADIYIWRPPTPLSPAERLRRSSRQRAPRP